ncbi:MAG: hypothetical protein KC493_07000 [Bacteriovoracaceae bacterium]|nr:hypothetical protein [Bacteriovoracaceae bacterium]
MRLYIFSILLSLLSFNAFSETAPKLVAADMAVMKIDQNPILYSDFNKYMSNLKLFRCMIKNSISLDAIKLDRKSHPKFPRFKMRRSSLNGKRKFIQKLVKLIKTQVYSSQFKLSVDKSAIKKIEKRRCTKGGFKKWPDDVRSLVLVEFYLRERFLDQERKNVKSDINQFIDSIDKKIPHDLYF